MGNKSTKINQNQPKSTPLDLLKQLRRINVLLQYAEKQQHIEKDYEECLQTYKDCLHIYQIIVKDPETTQNIRDKLFPQAQSWLLKVIDLTNLIYTHDLQKARQKQEDQNENEESNEQFQPSELVQKFLKSKDSSHLNPKMKNRIMTMACILNVSKPTVKLTDIIGAETAKKHAIETILYSLDEANLKQFRDGQPMGCIFYGQPGTGKTFLAKAIANEAECTFMEVSTTQIDDKYHGESAANVEAIFHLARILQPTIIFIDEIESMMPDRSNLSGSGATVAKIMSKFLTEMQGNAGQQVFVIGCTNYPDRIDVAFRRRFQRYIHVKLPDPKSQSQMMHKWYKGHDHTITKAEFDYMANRLQGMGPTDIHKLMDHALTCKTTEFYESESHKLVNDVNDVPQYVACANEDPNAVKLSRKELKKRKCVFPPVTAQFLFNLLKNAKPNVSAEVTKKMEDFEKSLGQLC